jgi:tetratricopeptide (TPR) repeat protein
MANISENLEKLHELNTMGDDRYCLNIPPKSFDIFNLETALGIEFPEAYKMFLSKFNGGMILEYNRSFYTDMLDWEPDGPKDSSFYFFSLDELLEKYEYVSYSTTMFSQGFSVTSPIIPICRTPDNKLIAVLSQRDLKPESPVYIIGNVEDMRTYVQIFDNFSEFLDKYVYYDGHPVLKYDKYSPPMSIFIYDNKLHIPMATEDPEEKLERYNAMLKIKPKDGFYYCARGNTYRDIGKRQLAMKDYNTAVSIDPEDAFYRYCRGDMVFEYVSARKALIDMDIAVNLEPKDNLFRNGRAKVFLKLNKLQEALNDCNIILENEEDNELALWTRIRVYQALGEFDKADADSARLDEIYDGQ